MSEHAELKRLAEAVRDNDIDWEPNQKTYDYFQALRNPGVVLALIAENERNAKNSAEWESASLHWMTERDQLKADNEVLRKDAERYRWLRDSSESIHQFYLSTPIWFTGVKFSKENVDSTIDTAMAQGEQP